MISPVANAGPMSSGDQAMGVLVDELTAKLQAGEPVDFQAYLRDHPTYAEPLRQLLPALQMLADLGSSAGISAASGVWPAAPRDDLIGILGDFRILGEVGRGGMGVVYEAEQISLGRRVALKVLPFAAALDAKQLQRFKNEAQAAAHLQHQNIVPVYYVGYERGVHFYAMQFIDGQTLATVIHELRQRTRSQDAAGADLAGAASALAKEFASGRWEANGPSGSNPHPTFDELPPVPEGKGQAEEPSTAATTPVAALSTERSMTSPAFFRLAANLGVQAAEALEHAHQLGIIHRDIKPANLLVDTNGRLWVTDFGLAHYQSQLGLTMTGDLLGTLRYMSPEQALAKHVAVDARTDIYSLGVTLYELLTLEPAYNGRNREAVLQQIAFEEPRPPRRLNRSMPAELETIVLKAMGKSPAERYATAQELADDLKRFLKDEPIRARRPSVWQRLRKWARRHQAVVATGAVAAAGLLVLAMVGLAISNALITREKGQKEAAFDQAQANYETAEANFELAFKAVDDIYEQFAEKFAVLPHLQPLQREFLQKALSFYQEFAKQRSTDRRLRRRTAWAYLRMGAIQATLGQRPQAEQPYARAVALFEELVAEDSAETGCREGLATAYHGLSGILGRKEEAQRLCRRAIALRTELSSDFPDSYAYGYQLSVSYRHLGLLLGAQPAEAEAAHRFSIKLCEKLAAKYGDKPELRERQASGYLDLGGVYQRAGRYPEAERALREVITLQQRGTLAFQGATTALAARAYLNLGQVLAVTNRHAEAEDAYRQSIAQYEKLAAQYEKFAAQFPHRESYWYVLYEECYLELTRLLEQTGRLGEEAAIRRRALDFYARFIAELPDEPAYRDAAFHVSRHLVTMLKDGGERPEREAAYREALELTEALAAKFPGDSRFRSLTGLWNATLGSLLTTKGRTQEAARAHRQAVAHYRTALELERNHIGTLNNLAWLLATCPEERFRDAPAAVQLAKQAAELAPQANYLWNTLGVALYRVADWKAAVAALEKSIALDAVKPEGESLEGFNAFFLAMAYWQLRDREKARWCYDRAVRWMEKYHPKDEELRRFRIEATELLGINEKPEPPRHRVKD